MFQMLPVTLAGVLGEGPGKHGSGSALSRKSHLGGPVLLLITDPVVSQGETSNFLSEGTE